MAEKSLKNKALDFGAEMLIGPNPAEGPVGESGTASAATKPSLPVPAGPAPAPAAEEIPGIDPAARFAPSPAQPGMRKVAAGVVKALTPTGPSPANEADPLSGVPQNYPAVQAPVQPQAAPGPGPAMSPAQIAAAEAKGQAAKAARAALPPAGAGPAAPAAGGRPMLTNIGPDGKPLAKMANVGGTFAQGPAGVPRGFETQADYDAFMARVPTAEAAGAALAGPDEKFAPGTQGYFERTGLRPSMGGQIPGAAGPAFMADANGSMVRNYPESVRGGGNPAAAIQNWNPQRGNMGGQRENIFANLIPRATQDAGEAFAGGGANTSMTGSYPDESDRTRRMREEREAGGGMGYGNSFDQFNGLRGPNGRISKTMGRLREQAMQNRTTNRGQDIAAETARMNEGGQMTRASIADVTNRRGQDMVQETARYGRDIDLQREGIQQDTSFGVANRGLAGQVYSADQNTARAAATSIAKNAGVDDSTVNKMIEMSVDPNTGAFSGDIFKSNYEALVKQMGGNTGNGAAGGQKKYGEGQIGKDPQGRSVIKRNGKWVPYNG